jgi:hypothetical protein
VLPLTRTVVVALSAATDGVVTRAALIAAGVDHKLPSIEVAARRWSVMAPGVYLTRPGPPSPRQLAHAAVLHAGPGCAVTGVVGCLLLQVAGLTSAARVTVLVPHDSKVVSTPRIKVQRSRAPVETTRIPQGLGMQPLPVAALDVCVADAIRSCGDLGDARRTAVVCLRDRRLDWSRVERHAHRRGPGAGHLRQVVQDVADGVRSPAEGFLHDTVLRLARRRRFPPYLLNPDVHLNGVLLGSPDLYVPGLGLGHEQDSREWHGEEHLLDATLLRHDLWRKAGLALDHVTPARFRDETDACLATLREAVEERRQLAVPEPPGLVVLGRGPLLPDRLPWPQVTGRRAA